MKENIIPLPEKSSLSENQSLNKREKDTDDRYLPKGISPVTLGFFQMAIAYGLDKNVPERNILLTTRYLTYDNTSYETLIPYAGNISRQRVEQIIKKTLKTLWKKSPDFMKEKYNLNEILVGKATGTVTDKGLINMRTKMSLYMKEKVKDPKVKEKMREGLKVYYKNISKEELSRIRKRWYETEEGILFKEKQSQRLKGRKLSEETKRKISEAKKQSKKKTD